MIKSLTRVMTRPFRSAVRKVVRETVKESKVDRRSFRRDALAAVRYFQLDEWAQSSERSGVHPGPPREPEVIVSLTSIPGRLFEVHTTIEALLRQTLRPDRIILWLDETKSSEQELPALLQSQMKRGLTVRFCRDIGPHTKYLPALREFPGAIIITVDDDVLYPSNLVEQLIASHRKAPEEIQCFRARRIHLPIAGPTRYSEHWTNQYEEIRGLDVVPLGVGGVLYPPNSLDPEAFNLEAQMTLAPKADDIWFKAMSLRKGTVCHRISAPSEPHPIRPNSQHVGLEAYNVDEGGNDLQIQATFDHYDLWSLLEKGGAPRWSVG